MPRDKDEMSRLYFVEVAVMAFENNVRPATSEIINLLSEDGNRAVSIVN